MAWPPTPAAAETAVALETPDGRLLPIIPDLRGRAFAVDSRLRNIDVELLVRRYAGVPMIQTIRVFRRKADGLYEIDYWCDICAISMFTLKPCECCQGPTRLREQLVEKPVARRRSLERPCQPACQTCRLQFGLDEPLVLLANRVASRL